MLYRVATIGSNGSHEAAVFCSQMDLIRFYKQCLMKIVPNCCEYYKTRMQLQSGLVSGRNRNHHLLLVPRRTLLAGIFCLNACVIQHQYQHMPFLGGLGLALRAHNDQLFSLHDAYACSHTLDLKIPVLPIL